MGLPLESGSAGSLTLFAALWSTSKWRGSQSQGALRSVLTPTPNAQTPHPPLRWGWGVWRTGWDSNPR